MVLYLIRILYVQDIYLRAYPPIQYKNYRSEPPMATTTMFGKDDNVWGHGADASPNAVVMLPPATTAQNMKTQTFKGTNGAAARRVSFGHHLF